jgi:transposase
MIAGTVNENNITLFVSLELSKSSWLVTANSPGVEKRSRHAVTAGDGGALLDLLARLKAKGERRIGTVVQVVVIQEAGLDGFWVHRLLEAAGIESHVVDPASIAVERRHRRAKTDAIDGETLLRTLMAWARGERRVCSMVCPPSPEEEDLRRLTRERGILVKERIQHTNRIRGLLSGQGIYKYDPLAKNCLSRLDALKTGDGRGLPPQLKAEVLREIDRIKMVSMQITAVERERDAQVRAQREVRAENPAVMLASLKGIGAELSSLIWLEALFRHFTNRRQVASYAGLAPSPWQSGGTDRDQGIQGRQPPLASCHDRIGLVLAAPSTGFGIEPVVPGACRQWPGAYPPDRDRGACPQAAGGALALCHARRRPRRGGVQDRMTQ